MTNCKIEKLREDLRLIADLIPRKSKVLDLGCGNGTLLEYLKREKGIFGIGIDKSEQKIIGAIEKGVSVIQQDLDEGLSQFKDKSFDYVILSRTLQSVNRPDRLLPEIVRIGKQGVISYINIGYITLRLQLFIKGEMPESSLLPYHWYDTPNIHLGTIKDFKRLCKELGIGIVKEFSANNGNFKSIPAKVLPNLFANTSIFLIYKKDSER